MRHCAILLLLFFKIIFIVIRIEFIMLPICKLVPDNLFIFQEGHAKLQIGEFDKIFSNAVKEVENDGRRKIFYLFFLSFIRIE